MLQRLGQERVGRSAWSLTHTAGFVACAFAAEGSAIGVDAEPLTSAERLVAMTETFLSPSEMEWAVADAGSGGPRLVELWTAKEARLKANGEGLDGPTGFGVLRALECTDTKRVDEWTTIAVRDVRTDVGGRAWVRLVGEHVLAVVTSPEMGAPPRLTRLPLQ